MGNCISENVKSEDKGLETVGKQSVGFTISDNQLALVAKDDTPKQKVLLTFSASNLPNMDKKSKTDCFAVLYFLKGVSKQK